MIHLSKVVNEDKDGVIATRFREINDEVIRDTFSKDIGNSDMYKFTHTLVSRQLCP